MQLITQNDTRPIVFFMSTTAGGEYTGGTPTVTISQDGGSFVTPIGAVTEIGNGFYKLTPSGTDTATLGPGRLRATGAGANNAYADFQVVAFDLYSASGSYPSPSAIATAVWGFTVTEAYSVLGQPSSYSAAAVMWDLRQKAYNIAIDGTTLSVLKTDGVTIAHTLTLNSAVSPSSARQIS